MDNIKIELLTENDLPIVNILKPREWPDLYSLHQFFIKSGYCYPIKVVTGNEIIGIGTAIYFEKMAWLACIIVAPEHRSKGIGSLIVQDLMDHSLNSCSCDTLLLIATDLGYPLYLKHGFVTQADYNVYTSNTEIPLLKISRNIKKITPEHYQQVLELDKYVTGENREQFIKPLLPQGYVYYTDRVLGYCLPDLGEGPVYAIEPAAGIELLKVKNGALKIVMPDANTAGRDYLLANGFKQTEVLKRMVYGKTFDWQPQHFYSRIGGWVG